MSVFKPHPQLLVDLINAENNAAVPYSALTVGAPAVNTDPAIAGDTLVTMTAKENSGYTGFVTASYSRLDLQQLFAGAEIVTLAISTNAETTRQMVAAIREAYGINLYEEDIVDEPITYLEDGTAQTLIRAAEGSYIFAGQIDVAISPVSAELSSILTVTVLNGLNYPLMDTSHLVEPTIVATTMTGSTVKENGTLLHGSGNPIEGYTVASNGELTMALAARLYKSGLVIEPVEGSYLLDVPDTGDWNITYSIDVPPQEATHSITSLYDVSLEFRSLDSGESLVFDLHPEGAGYGFRSEDGMLNIVDNTVADSGSVCQNIQRLQHYVSYFPSAQRNSFGSLLGNYEVELLARRKNSIAPVVRVVIGVVAAAEVETGV